jgi:Zinc-binding dehydrogenase
MHPSGTELAQLAELIEKGKLKVIVDKTYLFSNIAEALACVESGRAKGKVVVTMDDGLPLSTNAYQRDADGFGPSICSITLSPFMRHRWCFRRS